MCLPGYSPVYLVGSAISSGAPPRPARLYRSRSLDREELQAELVQAKMRAAQLELERDEHLMSARQLASANRLLRGEAQPQQLLGAKLLRGKRRVAASESAVAAG